MKRLFITTSLFIALCAFTPPGTIKVQTSFYIDKSEISNAGWAEYISYLKDWRQSDKENVLAVLPDSTVWCSVYHGTFTKDWSKNQNYPVVGISYEQAVNFCKWRSEAVRIKYHRKVKYRLPSQEEWSKFANTYILKEHNSIISENIQAVGNTSGSKKDALHLFDNISEMTSEKGLAIGNNFTDVQKGLNVHNYSKPEKWLGFRCACEVNR
jgi:formylglycine-generating enzyme required for sulfatase activity